LETESEKEYSRIRKYIFYTPKFTVNSENPTYNYKISKEELTAEIANGDSDYESYEVLDIKAEGRDTINGSGVLTDNLYSPIDAEIKIDGVNVPGTEISGYYAKFEFPYENWYTLGEGETGDSTLDISGVIKDPNETTFPDKYFRVIFFVSLK
jgi:hypothetical protein